MRIVADENILHAAEAFGPFGTVRLIPGRSMTRTDLRDADALLVRSVTRVDRNLLDGTPVRFVGSATIGTDHINLSYLRECGIAFAHAPGSNADSVVEYVLAALLQAAVRTGRELEGLTAGIVGCGNIGGRLAPRMQALGLEVLLNDPPRAETEPSADFLPLEDVLTRSDIVSLHVPLSTDGPHPTAGFIGNREFGLMKPEAWFVNTARGGVVDSAALLHARMDRGLVCMLDVWTEEPDIPEALAQASMLMTPHIAGYSYDGKLNGTLMLHEALGFHAARHVAWAPPAAGPAAPRLHPIGADAGKEAFLDGLVAQMYAISADDVALRLAVGLPPKHRQRAFHRLRRMYPRRHGFHHYTVDGDAVPEPFRRAVLEGLGVILS
jgi:erythronate-4-phosphate dehydrogenase